MHDRDDESCDDPACDGVHAPRVAHPVVPPGARDWAKEQAPVCMLDFQPQCYTALSDRLRVQRVGVLWYGEVRSHLSPLWHVVAEHHRSAEACMRATVEALGLTPDPRMHDCAKDHGQEPF